MFFIGEAPTRWAAAAFATFALSMTACLDRSEPSSSMTDATSNDAGEVSDVAVGEDGLCMYPPGVPIGRPVHVDCETKMCGESCDPCKDPRICVDATARHFACNFARQCVQWDD
jgi:hypothetical protein